MNGVNQTNGYCEGSAEHVKSEQQATKRRATNIGVKFTAEGTDEPAARDSGDQRVGWTAQR